ncbi:MAG: hypothetical protein ABI678_10120, partial [Kofleriaceae bacterium]
MTTEPVIMTVIEPVVRVPAIVAERPVVAVVVEVVRDTALRGEPRRDGALVGVIRRGTRARVKSAIDAKECGKGGRWIELAPRGWTCDMAVAPSDGEPTATDAVALDAE